MNIRIDEDPFAKYDQSISTIYNEVILLMKFLQTKPQNKNMNNNYYDLYYTVNKVGDENRDIDNQYENDFIDLNQVIIPNLYVGKKSRQK